MERTGRDLWVGLFILAGLAAIAFLSVSLGGASSRGPGGLELIATFDQVGGLKARAPVVVSGVKVGQVAGIKLADDLRARANFLHEQVTYKRDSDAIPAPESMSDLPTLIVDGRAGMSLEVNVLADNFWDLLEVLLR